MRHLQAVPTRIMSFQLEAVPPILPYSPASGLDDPRAARMRRRIGIVSVRPVPNRIPAAGFLPGCLPPSRRAPHKALSLEERILAPLASPIPLQHNTLGQCLPECEPRDL